MNELKVISNDEEYLRQISKDVDILNDKELEEDILILEEFCLQNEVMAMAAVQLGIPKRLIYIKNTNIDLINKINKNEISVEEKLSYNEARVLINPVIIKREGLTEFWEACASCHNNCARVLRPYKITVEYFDINNKKHVEDFVGFESTVLSHEYDHLNGVLHMDVCEENLLMTQEERKEFRKEHDYEIIKTEGDYEELKEEIHKSETLKAGCYLVDKNTKKVALVYREKKNDYSFPKGHLEDGETLKECAVREVNEEIKREVIIVDDEALIERYITPKGERCCCHMFIAVDNGKSNNTSTDTHEVVWVDFDEVYDKLTYKSLQSSWMRIKDKIKEILK